MSRGAGTELSSKALGCLIGGLIGDAIGTPSEGKDHRAIADEFGWIDDFDADGTDDTIMKTLLCRALVRTGGYATADDWAHEWLADPDAIFGEKRNRFFISVLHTARKLRDHATPRTAALGNMPSSSSAMAIAPVGIVNACNPRQAAMQAYSIASLIHVHDVAFCQDGAAAIAAAVAAAFDPEATVDSVIESATAFIPATSGAEMIDSIDRCLATAREHPDYEGFRDRIYAGREEYFHTIVCDSRETVPLALALVLLAGGDVTKAVTYGANFGRDTDTIATMSGAIAGALGGVGSIPQRWVDKAKRVSSTDQDELAAELAAVALQKADTERSARERLEGLVDE